MGLLSVLKFPCVFRTFPFLGVNKQDMQEQWHNTTQAENIKCYKEHSRKQSTRERENKYRSKLSTHGICQVNKSRELAVDEGRWFSTVVSALCKIARSFVARVGDWYRIGEGTWQDGYCLDDRIIDVVVVVGVMSFPAGKS